MEFVTISVFMLLLMIPLALVVRVIAAFFSQATRESILNHLGAHIVWLLVAVAVVLFVMLMPPLRHRRPTSPPPNPAAL